MLDHAVAAHQAGRFEEAEKLYRQAITDNPQNHAALYNLGVLCAQVGRPHDAVQLMVAALDHTPDFGMGWIALSGIACDVGNYPLAQHAAENAVRIMPDNTDAWMAYGNASSRRQDYAGAVQAFQNVVARDTSRLAAWVNLCVVQKKLGQLDAAEDALRQAFHHAGISTDGAIPESQLHLLHWHLALIELQRGDYRNGFAHFRARFYGGTDWKRTPSDKPLWQGEDLRGKTVYVTAEQGHGDALMLARYLPLIKARGASILWAVHPALVPLFSAWDAADRVVPLGHSVVDFFDFHVAMFDLPYLFGTEVATIPAQVPYLPAPVPTENSRLPSSARPKIAVVWGGNPCHGNDAGRSVPLMDFVAMFAASGADFYNMNRDKRDGDNALLAQYPNVIDLTPHLNNFADVARFIAQMDLVITCDTALAHLAGGLGKPTWVLLATTADWRWLMNRDDSPWYPTVRLFRRGVHETWGDVVARVVQALQEKTG